MKKLLLCLLLLVHLCSGMAFAWDSHPEAIAGHDAASFDLAADDAGQHPDSDQHHDNHGCHGAAHLTGIVHDTTTPVMAAGRDVYAFPAAAIPFRYLSPHLRPPIA